MKQLPEQVMSALEKSRLTLLLVMQGGRLDDVELMECSRAVDELVLAQAAMQKGEQ